MKKLLFVLMMWVGGFSSLPAFAQGIPVFDASNVANTLLIAQRSLEQVNNQLKMIEGLGFDASGELAQILNQTSGVLMQIEGLAYNAGQISQQFASAYPETLGDMSYDELMQLKDSILQQTRNTQKHAMEVQAEVAGSMPQTRGAVSDLVARSNSAPGTTAAVQANTQLLATISAQMSQMQALLMSQTRALNSYIQEQNTRSAIAAEQRAQMYQGLEVVPPRSDGFNPMDY